MELAGVPGNPNTFNTAHAKLLKSYPSWVLAQLPVHLAPRGALSKEVVSLLQRQVVHGTSFSNFHKMLYELHAQHEAESEVLYYQYLEAHHGVTPFGVTKKPFFDRSEEAKRKGKYTSM